MFKGWTIWLWENFNFLGTQAHTIPLRNCWAWEWTRCLASVRFDLWELVDTVYSIYFVLHGSHQKQIKDMFRFFFSLLYFKLTIFYGEVEYTTYFWVHDDMIRLMMTMTMTTTTMTTKMMIMMLINMMMMMMMRRRRRLEEEVAWVDEIRNGCSNRIFMSAH